MIIPSLKNYCRNPLNLVNVRNLLFALVTRFDQFFNFKIIKLINRNVIYLHTIYLVKFKDNTF